MSMQRRRFGTGQKATILKRCLVDKVLVRCHWALPFLGADAAFLSRGRATYA